MPSIQQNRLIPIFGVVILLCVAGVLYKVFGSGQHANVPIALKQVPKPERPADADTPADTLRTLTVKVNETKEEMQRLRKENQELKEQNEQSRRDKVSIEENVTRRLTEQFSRPEASGSPVFSGLNSKIDELAARLERYTPGSGAAGTGSDIPPGLGFDGKTGTVSGGAAGSVSQPAPGQFVWVDPLGTRTVIGPNGQPQFVRAAFAPADSTPNQPGLVINPGGVYGNSPGSAPAARGVPATAASAVQGSPAESVSAEPAKPKPYFTIPENSTLIGSTAMTALVGRIPVNGKVTDAMPFKVLIGRTNLAANGLEVPEDISGMVVSGIGVGDWTLSCSQGYIQSVTFLFNDGTIRTVSNRTKGALSGNTAAAVAGGGVANAEKIGWISDERGVPCISGERITNAPSYLSASIALKSVETAARAAALSQTTTFTNGFGGGTSAVTGDQNRFILGNMAAGGVNEITEWIKQRLNSSFDAVYVGPGLPVAVHLDQEIQIDKAPDARRLDYGRINGSKRARVASLD